MRQEAGGCLASQLKGGGSNSLRAAVREESGSREAQAVRASVHSEAPRLELAGALAWEQTSRWTAGQYTHTHTRSRPIHMLWKKKIHEEAKERGKKRSRESDATRSCVRTRVT